MLFAIRICRYVGKISSLWTSRQRCGEITQQAWRDRISFFFLQLWCWSPLITLTCRQRKSYHCWFAFVCFAFRFFLFPFLFISLVQSLTPSLQWALWFSLTTSWDMDLVNSCLAASFFETCSRLYLWFIILFIFFLHLQDGNYFNKNSNTGAKNTSSFKARKNRNINLQNTIPDTITII